MKKTAVQTAIENQMKYDHVNSYAEHVGPINVVKFTNLNAEHGAGALLLTMYENPNTTRKRIVELMHKKFHTTGQYTSLWGSLQRAGAIARSKTGFSLSELGNRIVEENLL